MADQTIDYDALAKQHGAIASTPPPQAADAIDYDALAKQHGALEVTGGIVADPDALAKFEAAKGVSIPLYNYPIDPATGQRTTTPQPITSVDKPLTPTEKFFLSPLEYLRGGMEQLGKGFEGITHPQTGEQMAGAASDIIRGGMQTATPFFLPEMLAAPLASLTGLATFGASQQLIERTTKGLGLPEGYSRLAGDIGGIWGGGRAYRFLADMAKIPDTRVADDIYRRLDAAVEGLKDPSLTPGDRNARKAAIDALLNSLRREEGYTAFPKLFPNPNEMQRQAYDYMRKQVGMTPSAAPATGNLFVQGAQKLTGMFPGGAMMDQAAGRADVAALRAHAGELVQRHLPEEPSGPFYRDFEKQVEASQPQNVPLYVGKDGSQVTGGVKAPVDIRDLKYAMQPLFDKMQFMPMADRSASKAYSALDALLKADDHIPAPTAEWGLSQFKAASREEAGGVAEDLAKKIIPNLQTLINDSVKTYAGDDALTALQQGRAAKAQEAGAEWLSKQFGKAEAAGGFDKEKVLWNEWAKLPETGKRTMFTPQQVENLNKFFLGAKMWADNPNPSGTALTSAVLSQFTSALTGGVLTPGFWATQGGMAGAAKLLRSDMGVKLLTEGWRIPRNSERGQFIQKKLQQILSEPAPGEGGPGGPSTPPSSPPPGGGPGGGGAPPPSTSGPNPTEPGMLEAYPELLSSQKPALEPPETKPQPATQAKEQLPPIEDLHKLRRERDALQSQISAQGGRFKADNELVDRLDDLAARIDAYYEQVLGPQEAPPPTPGEISKMSPAEAKAAIEQGGPKPLGVTEPAGISETFDKAANDAMQRMRDRGTFDGTKLNAGIPVEDMKDMAIWGAAKIAKGTVDFAKWSREVLKEAGPAAAQIKPRLQDIYAESQKNYVRFLASTQGRLPNTQKLLQMYKDGIDAKEWYDHAKSELSKTFGPDVDMFINFLAATSPNTTVASNTSLALKAYAQWKLGKPFEGYLPDVQPLLESAAKGDDFGGLKIQNFARNLHGDPISVTIDRWMMRALKFRGDSPTVPQYKFMDYLISQIAAKQGVEPRQMQAAIWKAIKDTEGVESQGAEPYHTLTEKKFARSPVYEDLVRRAQGKSAEELSSDPGFAEMRQRVEFELKRLYDQAEKARARAAAKKAGKQADNP